MNREGAGVPSKGDKWWTGGGGGLKDPSKRWRNISITTNTIQTERSKAEVLEFEQSLILAKINLFLMHYKCHGKQYNSGKYFFNRVSNNLKK